MSSVQAELAETSAPWWKVPHMWLVVGGPALVVVGCVLTIVIAIRNPDPVLNKAAYERDMRSLEHLEGQAKMEALIKMQPAHQARNHAASPVLKTQGE